MAVLTVPAKKTPFPYAAAGIAAYTSKAEIVFDDGASALSLNIAGKTIDDEDAILLAVAEDAALLDNIEKVLGFVFLPFELYFTLLVKDLL